MLKQNLHDIRESMPNKEDIIPFIVAGFDLPKTLSYGEQEVFGILFVLSLCRATELLPPSKNKVLMRVSFWSVCLSICLRSLYWPNQLTYHSQKEL